MRKGDLSVPNVYAGLKGNPTVWTRTQPTIQENKRSDSRPASMSKCPVASEKSTLKVG